MGVPARDSIAKVRRGSIDGRWAGGKLENCKEGALLAEDLVVNDMSKSMKYG
jgi:hypothetical protein